MAIEFHCPGCGKLVRTPDETAGKKGRCPHCQTKVQIPMASVATASTAKLPIDQKQLPAAPRAAEKKQGPGGSIRVVCVSCQKALMVPAASAGKQGKCPHCGTVMTIRESRPAESQKAATKRWKGSPQAAGPIQFDCPNCHRLVKVSASGAGRRGQCPHCRSLVQIPHKSTAPAPPAPRSGGTPGLTPLGPADTGLTPIDNTPGAAANDPFADFPDLGNAAGGDPLGSFPADLGNASSNPFGGGGGYAANPYSPSLVPSTAAPKRKIFKPSVDVARNGLPWEKKLQPEGAFGKTARLILFSPNKAFCMMKREGGIGRPLAFGYLGFVGGFMINVLYAALVLGILFVVAYFMFQAGGNATRSPGAIAASFGIIMAVAAISMLVQTSIMVVIGGFLNAGIYHLLLMMVGGANYSYETTYRATAYSMGACGAFLVIPIVGYLAMPFLLPIITIFGLKNAHETSGGRAAFAVLLPYVIFCGCYVGLLVFGNVVSMISSPPQAPPGL